MDQDEFVAGGLPDNFDGEVVEARAVIWNYDNGNGPKYVKDIEGNDTDEVLYTLAARLVIQRDDEPEPVTTYFSAGDPTQFVPSLDGRTPAPADDSGCSEGIYFIRTGAKSALNNNTNYAQFLQALADAEAAAPQLKRPRTPDIRFLEGLYGHWDRIPQKKRAGIVRPEVGDQRRDILAVTQLKTKPAASKPAPIAKTGPKAIVRPAPAAPAAPAPAASRPTVATARASSAATTAAGDDLTSKLQAIVAQAALDAGDDGIPKGKLATRVLKNETLTQPERAKGVPMVTSTAFLEAGMELQKWLFDAETGTVHGWPVEAEE